MADSEGLVSGGVDLPILAPGQVYVEVEYDYEYKAKDKMISIRQGECYMLVRKTNEDWWQVRKEEGIKAFYVPAQYVREVRRALMPPPKTLVSDGIGGTVRVKPTVLDICSASNENLNNRLPQEMSSFGSPSPTSTPSPSWGHVTPPSLPKDANQNPESPRESKPPGNHHHSNSSKLPHMRADSPPPRAPNNHHINHSKSHDSDRTLSSPGDSPGEGSEKLQNDSESGDDLSSSSTEHMQTTSPIGQGRPESPIYTNLQELKISQSSLPTLPSSTPLHILGDWETHKDLTGRHFYYNRATGERTWKPPRARDASGSTSSSRGDPHGMGEMEPSEKCGVLNVTKITENGKKVRKNWTSSWTVLQGSSLLFAKGQGSGTSWFGGNQSKPEFTVDLRGGSVDWASKDKSSKKHVIELKTRQGTELLIQSEIDSVINDWFRVLTDTISTHVWESDEALEEDMPESPGAEKQDKEKDHRDSKKNRAMKTSVSMDSSDQKKTRVKLKKFLTRRPTYQAVRDKGYIKDQVFGCSLSSLCQRENTSVPTFVTMCIDHVENTGLSIDGIYRVSGNLAVIQKLRFAVNHDEKIELDDSKWEDIHVTTGALKMLFRELPEPVFTYDSFNDFINAIKCSDYKQRVNMIKDLIKHLPKPNHDTMQCLFKHLRRVIDHGEANRMTTQSVAIVFGPTLLRPETETGNIAVHMVYQNQIVELILLEYENIFGR
uniref:Rho GTPase-activating protein 12-like n=1 Tax=Oncorhynchus tshawytscha TaxID=74940 RepID=A0A8C8GRJ7_ONCTS